MSVYPGFLLRGWLPEEFTGWKRGGCWLGLLDSMKHKAKLPCLDKQLVETFLSENLQTPDVTCPSIINPDMIELDALVSWWREWFGKVHCAGRQWSICILYFVSLGHDIAIHPAQHSSQKIRRTNFLPSPALQLELERWMVHVVLWMIWFPR